MPGTDGRACGSSGVACSDCGPLGACLQGACTSSGPRPTAPLCTGDAGCSKEACDGGSCNNAGTCNNALQDGLETDVDCGGPCPACKAGKGCNLPSDCTSNVCGSNVCQGGATCSNNQKDPDETDLDCGGACLPCALGKTCKTQDDCVSSSCVGGLCKEASCSDSAKNQGESDVDCGGPCPKCGNGKSCGAGTDCQSMECAGGRCCGGEGGQCSGHSDCCAGSYCFNSFCWKGCFIDGKAWVEGAVNPSNGCERCAVALSASAWSAAADATNCGTSLYCYGGKCTPCVEGAACVPANPCHKGKQSCSAQGASCVDQGTNRWNGDTCGTGLVCANGACRSGCYVGRLPDGGGGAFFDAGAALSTDPCVTCQPSLSTTNLRDAGWGTSCGTGKVCYSGACTTGCWIGNTLYPEDAGHPTDRCQACASAQSTTSWTPRPTGAACSYDSVCLGGTCKRGCWISSQFLDAGTLDPSNGCRACLPHLSTSAYSSNDGVRCDTDKVCFNGACQVGCYCTAVYYGNGVTAPGVISPGITGNYGCAKCDPTVSVNCLSTPNNTGGRCYFPSGCTGYCSGVSCQFSFCN